MRGILFGGEGFIGRHLAEQFIRRKAGEVTVVSLDLAESTRREGHKRRFVKGDVREKIFVASLEVQSPGSPDVPPVIFNLAAVHRTPGHPEHEYFETNLRGAENVCDFARQTNARTIVFTSSIAPYGASEPLKTEETLPLPNTPYGISKLIAEHIHRTWQAERPNERRLVIVRPGVVFGHGEGGNMTRLYWAMKRRRFVFPGRTDTIKACIYVKDVARLLVEMAESPEPGVFLYNLTYEPAPTIQEICAVYARVTGVTMPKLIVPGAVLKTAAAGLGSVQGLLGEGFHPDRVKKLMISNNISGKKLLEDGYALNYSLEEAVRDWWKDCGEDELV